MRVIVAEAALVRVRSSVDFYDVFYNFFMTSDMRTLESRRYGLWAVPVLLIAVGELLIVLRHRPESDFYFPFAWVGYILLLDRGLLAHLGRTLWTSQRAVFLAMLPLSAAFWWIFELFNAVVHNWTYVGTEPYRGLRYVVYASVDFSLVLLAVWYSATFVHTMFPVRRPNATRSRSVPTYFPIVMLVTGVACIALPIALPRYTFGLIWVCLFFVLDPINHWLQRPSILSALARRDWRLPASFALGALMCGAFWECWNFWAMPKWTYTIPFVGFWHIFEMPFLGWFGYLPFGLELFAMTNFVLPFLRLGTITLPSGANQESR